MILEENIVFEDEKFYPMMRVQYQGIKDEKSAENVLCCRYGRHLLKTAHPVLKQYLEREARLYSDIYEEMKQAPFSDKVKIRMTEVEEILRLNGEALEFFKRKRGFHGTKR